MNAIVDYCDASWIERGNNKRRGVAKIHRMLVEYRERERQKEKGREWRFVTANPSSRHEYSLRRVYIYISPLLAGRRGGQNKGEVCRSRIRISLKAFKFSETFLMRASRVAWAFLF